MSPDFENTPLKDYKTGRVLRFADGEPILYKHFLDDPDEDYDTYSKMTLAEKLAYWRRLDVSPENYPDEIRKADAEDKKQRQQNK